MSVPGESLKTWIRTDLFPARLLAADTTQWALDRAQWPVDRAQPPGRRHSACRSTLLILLLRGMFLRPFLFLLFRVPRLIPRLRFRVLLGSAVQVTGTG